MKKKQLLIVSFILIVALLLLAAQFIKKRVSQDNANDKLMNAEYTFDPENTRYNYSENTVLYLDDKGLLHMVETNSGKDIIYCDRPNCTHEGYSHDNENPSCPAAFWGLTISGTVLYNNHLYCLGNMTSEGGLQKQYLYEMDTNCENRKIIATIDGVQDIRYALYRDGYVIGAYSNWAELNDEGQIINGHKPEMGIFVIDLANNKVYMGESISEGQPGIMGMYYENGIVYYVISHFDEEVTELMLNEALENDFETFIYEKMIYEIYQYDIESKTTRQSQRFDHIKVFYMSNGAVVFENDEGYSLYNMITGEIEELDIDSSKNTLWGGICKNEDTDYYALLNLESNEVIYYRMKDNEQKELMRMKPESFIGITCICGDSVYVSYTDDGRYCLGVTSLSEFDQGRLDVKRVRCYDEE